MCELWYAYVVNYDARDEARCRNLQMTLTLAARFGLKNTTKVSKISLHVSSETD